jgi:hypothetical protein
MHLAPATPATELRINYEVTPKPRINLAELAEVLAAVPAPIRHVAPLPVLQSKLYGLAFDKVSLIEEVELVYRDEEQRRQQVPRMTIAR